MPPEEADSTDGTAKPRQLAEPEECPGGAKIKPPFEMGVSDLEKSISMIGAPQFAGKFFKVNGIHPADGRLFCFTGAEALKVMFSNEIRGSLFHLIPIQRFCKWIQIFPVKHMKGRISGDPVAIGFGRSVEPAVESRSRFFHGQDSDIFRQPGVEIRTDLFCGKRGIQMDIGDLSQGMDSCIGASGPMDLHFRAGHED